jgi:hypothetical protein
LAAKDIDPLDNGINPISIEGGTQDWVLTCGVCHVGGGQLEYDRDGDPYDNVTSPDGDRWVFDYPTIAFPNGQLNLGFMSDTNKAEVDCLLCHLDWTVDAAKNNNGLALLQTWGCDSVNLLGPLNDRECADVTAAGALSVGPGISYDMYNRNYAIKNKKMNFAASMGLGAVGKNSLGEAAPQVGDLASISWGASVPVINAAAIAGTPKSANCAPCHARDDDTQALPNMAGMKYGFGNYLLQFAANTIVDTDSLDDINDVYWLDFGCKTGMGKRAHKIGIKDDAVGANGKYGAWGMAANPAMGGDPAIIGTPIPNKMPDIDVHDMGGMSCATCHYGLGSETVAYAIDPSTGAITSGQKLVDAGEFHHVDYAAEAVNSMDHQFAQPDSFPDVKGKNNLDNTVSCESCHDGSPDHPRVVDDGDGTFSLASDPTVDVPQPTHPAFPAFHMDKIACATCHIPETYNAPGRLKYRDWTAGFYKGGFRNILDFAPNFTTGSHDAEPVVRQWLTKNHELKIYPVLPSVMPIWIESVSNTGAEAGTEATLADGSCDAATDPLNPVCVGGQRAGLECVDNTDCTAVGTGYPTGDLKSPIKARDAGLAARLVRDLAGNPYDIRINGGNQIPLFDGFAMADSWEIDTAAEINDMIVAFNGGTFSDGTTTSGNPDNNTVALKLFQANFDVTHGIVPTEWALGGSARGGCNNCHSSHDPNSTQYNPISVGFFEGHVSPLKAAAPTMKAMGIPTGMAVGGYDVIKNWFALFADFDCTALCGMGALSDADLFNADGTPILGTTCTPGSMVPDIDSCVGMMTTMMDAAMGFQPGTAQMMGFYDGIAGMTGLTVRETVSGDLAGCNPLTNPGPCVTQGLIYTRQEARSHWKIDLQQTYTGAGGAKRVTWPVGGEKNPSNPAHVNSWDQADYCLDYSAGNPFAPGMLPCNGSGPDMIPGNTDDAMPVSMDGNLHIANMIPANAYLGYAPQYLSNLMAPQSSAYFANLKAEFSWLVDATVPRQINLDGSSSLCPPGQTCTYSWDYGEAAATADETDIVKPAVTYTTVGSYNVTLTVEDEHGYTATKTRTVLATDIAAVTVPAAAAVDNADGSATLTVTAGTTNLKSFYALWNDGSAVQPVNAYNMTSRTVTHQFVGAPSTFTMAVYVIDMQGKGQLIWLDPLAVTGP